MDRQFFHLLIHILLWWTGSSFTCSFISSFGGQAVLSTAHSYPPLVDRQFFQLLIHILLWWTDHSFNCSFIFSFGWFVIYLQKVFHSICRSEKMKDVFANSIPTIDSAGSSLPYAKGGFWCFPHHMCYDLRWVWYFFPDQKCWKMTTSWELNGFSILSFNVVKIDLATRLKVVTSAVSGRLDGYCCSHFTFNLL